MTVTINRLFHGLASVRDYQVEEARKLHEDLTIKCGDEIMTVPYNELDSGTTNNYVFKSKHDSKSYKLIDFIWQPDAKQASLL